MKPPEVTWIPVPMLVMFDVYRDDAATGNDTRIGDDAEPEPFITTRNSAMMRRWLMGRGGANKIRGRSVPP